MKWFALLALLALALVATHAESGHFVDGVEYVDNADEMPHADMEEVFSFIDQELGTEDAFDQFALIDSESETESEADSESELENYSTEEYQQAIAFIATDAESSKGFKNSLKKLGKKIKNGIKKTIQHGKNQIVNSFVKMGRKGFQKLPPKVQQLIRRMVDGGKKKPAAKKPAAKKPKHTPRLPPMDPFAAKHYKRGFVPGRLGRPHLLPFAPPQGHNQLRMVEDCMSCRFVWQSVEMDVGNTNAQKTVYDSFMSQCRRGMGAPIMYQPCQMMFAHLDDMVTGYTSGLAVNEICAQARLCR